MDSEQNQRLAHAEFAQAAIKKVAINNLNSTQLLTAWGEC
jgi:hypothetical protein